MYQARLQWGLSSIKGSIIHFFIYTVTKELEILEQLFQKFVAFCLLWLTHIVSFNQRLRHWLQTILQVTIKFSDRQFRVNSVDPDQTAPSSLIRVYTVYYSVCIFWTRSDPKFSDRYAWANSADPDQTAPFFTVLYEKSWDRHWWHNAPISFEATFHLYDSGKC